MGAVLKTDLRVKWLASPRLPVDGDSCVSCHRVTTRSKFHVIATSRWARAIYSLILHPHVYGYERSGVLSVLVAHNVFDGREMTTSPTKCDDCEAMTSQKCLTACGLCTSESGEEVLQTIAIPITLGSVGFDLGVETLQVRQAGLETFVLLRNHCRCGSLAARECVADGFVVRGVDDLRASRHQRARAGPPRSRPSPARGASRHRPSCCRRAPAWRT